MTKENDFLEFQSSHGIVKGFYGDCVAITFAKSGNCHTPVAHSIWKTITTFCDHDIGVIVYE